MVPGMIQVFLVNFVILVCLTVEETAYNSNSLKLMVVKETVSTSLYYWWIQKG
jgi:hypothetical protein